MRLLPLFLLVLSTQLIMAQNETPEISNLSASIDDLNKIVTLNYDLFDADDDLMQVHFLVSNNGGETYSISAENASGDIGSAITSGMDKTITWDATNLLTGRGDYQVKIVADDLYEIDIQGIVDQVDSSRIRSNLQFIEGVRHRNVDPDHLSAIKDSIEQRFILANLDTYRDDFIFGSYTGQNIIGRLEGTIHPDSTYIIDGHFDTVSESPGADDNGSAIAGMLEALRVLASYNFTKTIRFIGFDLEEEGLKGSFDYTANGIPSSETIKGVFNMEMIGYYTEEPNSQTFPPGFEILYPTVQSELMADQFRGNFITNIGDQNSIAFLMAYEEVATQYVPELKVISLAAPSSWATLTPDFGRSDHAPFWLANIPAIMLTDGSNFRNPNYHTSNDQISTLNFNFMTNIVKSVVGAIAEQGGLHHSTSATTEFSVITSTHQAWDCDLSISPVPTNDHVQLLFGDCAFKNLRIQLFDSLGKLVLEKELKDNISGVTNLDLSVLKSGFYLMRLNDGVRKLDRKILLN